MLVARRLHDAERQGGVHQVELVHGLLDELIAVRQDERPPAAALHEQGKDNGFPRPRRQDEQGTLDPTRRSGKQGRHGFVLVGPGRQTERGR